MIITNLLDIVHLVLKIVKIKKKYKKTTFCVTYIYIYMYIDLCFTFLYIL